MLKKQGLILSILTLVTVLSWIIFDIYHVYTSSTISPIQQELMKPLTPEFDLSVISDLKKTAVKEGTGQ